MWYVWSVYRGVVGGICVYVCIHGRCGWYVHVVYVMWPLLEPLVSISPEVLPSPSSPPLHPHPYRPQEGSSFCFQPQMKICFRQRFMSLEQCLSWSPALPPFLKALSPWTGCQNFTLICCSLEPESLNLIKRKIRKCAVYLITMNSWHLALSSCMYTHNCLTQIQGRFTGGPPVRK